MRGMFASVGQHRSELAGFLRCQPDEPVAAPGVQRDLDRGGPGLLFWIVRQVLGRLDVDPLALKPTLERLCCVLQFIFYLAYDELQYTLTCTHNELRLTEGLCHAESLQ
jgi:hypothetical protein